MSDWLVKFSGRITKAGVWNFRTTFETTRHGDGWPSHQFSVTVCSHGNQKRTKRRHDTGVMAQVDVRRVAGTGAWASDFSGQPGNHAAYWLSRWMWWSHVISRLRSFHTVPCPWKVLASCQRNWLPHIFLAKKSEKSCYLLGLCIATCVQKLDALGLNGKVLLRPDSGNDAVICFFTGLIKTICRIGAVANYQE